MTAQDEVEQLHIEVDQIVQGLNKEANSRARRVVNVLRNAALDVLGQKGHGRKYGKHTASAPGEAPAPNTGNLRRNWRQYVLGEETLKGIKITARIKSDVPYASILEKGTRRMRPRPFSDRIVAQARPEVDAIYGGL